MLLPQTDSTVVFDHLDILAQLHSASVDKSGFALKSVALRGQGDADKISIAVRYSETTMGQSKYFSIPRYTGSIPLGSTGTTMKLEFPHWCDAYLATRVCVAIPS